MALVQQTISPTLAAGMLLTKTVELPEQVTLEWQLVKQQ